MKLKRSGLSKTSKRRTTLTLPSDSLAAAEKIARKRNVNLSVVVSEALADGLRSRLAAERADEILEAYRKAFSGFSSEEMLVLDGVVLDRPEE